MNQVVSPHPSRLLRLPEVLRRVPIGKSSWWSGVRSGKYPRPVKLSSRTTCWRESDIDALIASLGSDPGQAA